MTLKTAANGAHKNLPIIFPSKEEKIVPMACEFFSGDRMLAVGGMDNVVTLFDRTQTTCEKKKVLVGHEGYISAIKMLGDKMVTEAGLTYLPPHESLGMSHTPPARLTGFNRWWTDGTVGKL